MKLLIILWSLFKMLSVSDDQLKPVNFSLSNTEKLFKSQNKNKINDPDSTLPSYKKLAVLVGVDDYKYLRPLSTSVNSINELAINLRMHGYDTMVYLNKSQTGTVIKFYKELDEKIKTENYDVVLFYLSGHFDAINEDELFFLLPECNPIGDKNNYLVSGTFQVFNLASKILRMKSKIKMLLIDGPSGFELGGPDAKQSSLKTFMQIGQNSNMLIGSGLSDFQPSKGSNGPISLYSEAIINSLNTPDLNLIQAFDNVNKYVQQKTGGKITPTYKTLIKSDFCFSCK